MVIADLKSELKELDGGKILGALSDLPAQLNFKGLENKFYVITDPIREKAEHLVRLGSDMIQWPGNFMQSVVGDIKDKFSK